MNRGILRFFFKKIIGVAALRSCGLLTEASCVLKAIFLPSAVIDVAIRNNTQGKNA